MSFSKIKASLKKRSPEIAIAIGVLGMITTVVMAVKATPKAMNLIKEEQNNSEKIDNNSPVENIIRTVKVTWKCYIPATITGVLSVSCIVGASAMNVKRKTAMEAACLISSTALHKYGEKVVEVIGENKDREVRDEIAKDYLKREPIKSKQIIITNKGDVRCFDVLSGRYFQSTIDSLNKAANDLNRRMRDEYAISLNDFYWEIGLDNVKLGDMLGWNIDRGYIELDFSAQITDDNIPCIVVGYRNPPTYMC